MTFEEAISRIVNDLKEQLIIGISDSSDKNIIIEGFTSHILVMYKGAYQKLSGMNGFDYEIFLRFIIENENSFLSGNSQDNLDYFKYGSIFREMEAISSEALNMALEYQESGVVDLDYQNKKNDIVNRLKKYEEMAANDNRIKQRYEYLFSETIVDIDYAGGVSDSISFRMKEQIVL